MEGEDLIFNLVQDFAKINEPTLRAIKVIDSYNLKTKKEKISLYLQYIACKLLPSKYFQEIVINFGQILPKLIQINLNFDNLKFNYDRHLSRCILLGKLVDTRPDLAGFAIEYFEQSPSPFIQPLKSTKRVKVAENLIPDDLEVVEACLSFLQNNRIFYRNKWNWSEFIDKYFNHNSIKVQWICCQCLAIVCGMSEKQLKTLIESRIPREINQQLICKYNKTKTLTGDERKCESFNQEICVFSKSKIEDKTVEIAGIYLSQVDKIDDTTTNLILVQSTCENLRKIATSLNTTKAICLQGPIGCGKTTFIEYLARKTGRKLGKNFIKIQLGDQTDVKMLLGTYRCTDIPGEFVWQAGILTQAVLEGHWLLLEDIDSVSTDVASVLSSLLENSTLSVPGYRDSIPIKSGFQVFFTQRFITTTSGNHRQHSNCMNLLEKNLIYVNIDPLSVDELKTIIVTLYPQFVHLTDRMIRVFQLFSKYDEKQYKSNRLISTRDFFKWLTRVCIDFDVSSPTNALKILQDAIDVFCCSLSNHDQSLNASREICSILGIINEKADYFYKTYKPIMKLTENRLQVGRAFIDRNNEKLVKRSNYYFTRPSGVLLERIMCCVNLKEPVLLVGETGTGKTSTIQYLADTIGQKLIVINMNQQSDSSDLLGGYKPVDVKFLSTPIRREFEHLFGQFYQIGPNKKFLSHISCCYNQQRWHDLIKLMLKTCQVALKRLNETEENDKNREFLLKWQDLNVKLEKLDLQLRQKTTLAFSFIEGSLVKAIENGYWVLLDEINLANAETLECLSGLLEGIDSSICLLEKGDKTPIKRHKDFLLFACMNPSTDVGKKDLPFGLRNRFTEFYINELTDKSDLLLLVSNYLKAQSLKSNELSKIVDFYLKVRELTDNVLIDGLGHKPHYSLRSLCRALTIASRNPCGNFKKSLYEAFCLSFLTQLDSNSYKIVENTIRKYLLGDDKNVKTILNQPIPQPMDDDKSEFIQFEGYWVKKGCLDCYIPQDYILTDCVRKNLKDLVRIVSIGKLPVLLQGDTSVGKTSLIQYLAKSSGNKCVRINNHEHTDLQEYIGSYIADINGKLIFREGLLVEAMRKGYWIILDELNLAPTDVLEALNRVLDDNRELFIPETQETIKANKNFMLFATQNPPGLYGGRKMLSRAFRNRFVELHFNEIPSNELSFILHKRCSIPESYTKKMIAVMTDLQLRRRGSAVLAGKQGFITLRDLFRWGERYHQARINEKLYDWDQHLADEGFLVLAGRVRKLDEKHEIRQVLQKHLKRQVDPHNLFTLSSTTSTVTREILEKIEYSKRKFPNIVWTYNMRQLAVLVLKAFEFNEPVLLVGETGGGKTTICQIIAEQNQQKLVTVNCHMHTESSDFIGGLRPVRDHQQQDDDINRLFEWVDGPLIEAMVHGDVFLADEISLADDSVLERLNSLLEPERTLLLAEKGVDLNNTNNSELIVANDRFHFIGTMNPGGDFGKKELSPALRNRFTEIWCETIHNRDDLVAIIENNLKQHVRFDCGQHCGGIGGAIMDFIEWLQATEIGKRITISVRDILTWVNFINSCDGKVDVYNSYLHGAYLTFLDSLGTGTTGMESRRTLEKFAETCHNFLRKQLENFTTIEFNMNWSTLSVDFQENSFGIQPFYIEYGDGEIVEEPFCFQTPTTVYNTLRLLRGMQLNKAILLEGSPGVGKTSLVQALAQVTRHRIHRINLSDQTDIADLFGADLPVEGGVGGQFAWRDGPLLQALKRGDWILLDELNLASQSVLEGLNACLDHRSEIFIPELNKTFHITTGTRFFACQNPLKQGGSRRGLPQSFLNRFIQVFINSLTKTDLYLILIKKFDTIPEEILQNMLDFNWKITEELENFNFGNKGGPWEFNLRDLTRWCELTIFDYKNIGKYQPEKFVKLIYCGRMRTFKDRQRIQQIFVEIFNKKIPEISTTLHVNPEQIYLNDINLPRFSNNGLNNNENNLILRTQLPILRHLAYCVRLSWMTLLVGGSATGKTSIVKTLANLTGKNLRILSVTSAMDTTDILGGFEQTDYSRHLEEILKETEHHLLDIVQIQLVKDNAERASQLLSKWHEFSVDLHEKNVELNGMTITTMQKEMEGFLVKLENLDRIWQFLLSTTTDKSHDGNLISSLRNRIKILKDNIRREGSLNAGGKFEWIDSILIKCLKDGSWLLVDNVNLCSAAVLDRLNALLEPNGKLTINERGVDQYGRMIEIYPHQDFRLFFTLDPKNGEISRAMRNRGVEIFILNNTNTNESEFIENRNNLDWKSLINYSGLNDTKHINNLLKLHDFITCLILSDKPTINDLIRTGTLISQELKIMNNQRNIEREIQIFLKSILEVYYKKRLIIEFNCNDFPLILSNKIREIFAENNGEDFSRDFTLRTGDLQKFSDLEQIKQQCVLIPIFQQQPNICRYLLIHFYTLAVNSYDLHLRYLYINQQISGELLQLSTAIFDLMKMEGFNDFPLEYRWFSNDDRKTKEINRILLRLHFVSKQNFEDYDKNSLWNYMIQVRNRKIQDYFNDDLIIVILDLIEEFDRFLLENLQQIDDDRFIKLLYLLNWRFILKRYLMMINLKKLTKQQQYLIKMNLRVYCKWFLKNSIYRTFEILNLNQQIGGKFTEIRKNCEEILEKQLTVFNKIHKNFRKFSCVPEPQISLEIMEESERIQKIYENFDICHRNNNPVEILEILEINRHKLIAGNLDVDSTVVPILDQHKLEILPFMNYFIQLKLRNSFKSFYNEANLEEIDDFLTIPLNLITTINNYRRSNDKKLQYRLFYHYFNYLTNSASVKSGCYYGYNEDLALTDYNPLLCYHLNNLLIPLNSMSVVKYGNYQKLQQQHRKINLLLWQNFKQISTWNSNDYLTNEWQLIDGNYRNFIEIFNKSTDGDFFKNTDLNQHLLNCKNHYENYTNLNDNDLKLWTISNIYIEMAYVKLIINSYLPIIDPAVKNSLKQQYCNENIKEFEEFQQTLLLLSQIYCDRTINHPHLQYLKLSIRNLQEKLNNLQKFIAIRPKTILYDDLIKVIKHGLSTILSENFITEMLTRLNESFENLLKSNQESVIEIAENNLKRYENYLKSYENLMSDWLKFSPTYPDIIEILLGNIAEFFYGLKLNLFVLRKTIQQRNFERSGIRLQQEFTDLLQFPIGNTLIINQSCNSQRFYNFLDGLFKTNDGDGKLAKFERLRLLKCGLLDLYNDCLIHRKFCDDFNEELFRNYNNLLKIFVNAWNQQEKDREIQQQEAEALYKTKIKCEDKSEDEQIEDELKELFPNYHDLDFNDFINNTTIGDDCDVQQIDNNLEISNLINDDDLKFVVNTHMLLIQNFVRTEWLNCGFDKKIQPDFINSLIEKLRFFKQVSNKILPYLDYTFDKELFGSLNVLLKFVENYGNTNCFAITSSPNRYSQQKHYDYYKDPNVDEVKSSFHILEELKLKNAELLNEWPDHPTLKSISIVIERLYNFEITSPLSRFLTGFEILLNKCNEWEEVAHSKVSLFEYSKNLTQQIIEWRKIELNQWKNLLNLTYERVNVPIYKKWWLFLYNLIDDYLINNNQLEINQLIDSLQKFVIQSNLGEFEKRLELIYCFHCHCVCLKQQFNYNNKLETFINILWNIYCYFQQFLANILNRIKELRTPIEKKLKDYVKIVRWKDINYWAIKQTIDKSHKTLHKFIREYREVLQQPVQQYLTNFQNLNEFITNNDNGIWDRPQRKLVKIYHYIPDITNYIVKDSLKKRLQPELFENHMILSKLDRYFNKSRKYCKEILIQLKYPQLIRNLDLFIIQIIETSQYLRNLEIDTKLSKEKQKKLAKNYLQQKQRSLADLFKQLSKLGLSYRTGLVLNKMRITIDDYLLKPLDLAASFHHLNYSQKVEKILTIWEKCEDYYVKSLMRADVLATALKTPSPDLGLHNIDRCQGFSSHLLDLSYCQKSDLIKTSRIFYYLRHYTTQMTELCETQHFLESSQFIRIENWLKTLITNVQQLKIILQTCPEHELIELTEIIILKPERKFIENKTDENWRRIDNSLTEMQNNSTKLLNQLEKSRNRIPSFNHNLLEFAYIPVHDPENLRKEFNNISKNLDDVLVEFEQVAFVENLRRLKHEINDTKSELFVEVTVEENHDKLLKLVEKLSEKILIIIQNFVKNSSNNHHEETVENIDEEEANCKLEENHLKTEILENLNKDLKLKEMKNLLDLVEDIVKLFYKTPNSNSKQIIMQILPLLEQILLFYQYFLTQQVLTYRITNKMTSILLNIFIELASKGFCIPRDLIDENNEDCGESQQSSGGVGLGDGQGEKDISDKIESEDQLDDAQPAGQEKQQDQDDPDCKEEDKGIEMSTDFDSKLQDIEKNDNDDEDNEENDDKDEDADEQMGDTGKEAEKLDQQIWGSDEEEDDQNDDNKEEEAGDRGEEDGGESQLGAKNKETNNKDDNKKNDDENASNEKEENRKEINELEEPEYDDEQTDPYHGNQPELPEPEPMELPDDLQLDDGVENQENNEGIEENPLDIDNMKEDNPFEQNDEDQQNDDDKNEENRDDQRDYSSEDEEITNKPEETGDNNEEESGDKNDIDERIEEDIADKNEDEENKHEEISDGLDQTQSNEDHVEAMDIDNSEPTDNTKSNQNQNQKSHQPINELRQDDKENQQQECAGQAQSEDTTNGHQAQTTQPQEMQNLKRQYDDDKDDLKEHRKPGESDSQRSLGDINETVKKKLKTIDQKIEELSDEPNVDHDDDSDNRGEAEIYQHIRDANKEQDTTQVLDVATKEQAENQNIALDEDKDDESIINNKDEDQDEIVETPTQEPEMIDNDVNDKKEENRQKSKQHPDGEILDNLDRVEIDGDIVETVNVPRENSSSHHTNYNDLTPLTIPQLTLEQINVLREEVAQQLSNWCNTTPDDNEADTTWQKITSLTSQLAQDLAEQLRLILEPTQSSRLRGDYRTGRRINLRKIIPYIASQFRKDKIWLRRTKPSKRDYQIVVAIDDSSSMCDNHSKELTFESCALISKALTILESGQLSIISFGETIEILHKLNEQFVEKSGCRLLQKFQFNQNKTCIGRLIDFVTEMFQQTPPPSMQQQSNLLTAKLLIIVSDGRGVFSEGELYVREAVRRAKLSNIFMIFVIIDNPNNKHSILDIRMPVFKDGKLLNIENYMDVFPFNFYIILRDINSLPNVLSDALRQWFEVVTNFERR